MGKIFRAPSMPAPVAPPPPPTPMEDPAVAKRLADAQEAERKARGRASTILTSGLDDSSTQPSARRTLLPG